ncbi:MAG: hypothetical protein ACO32U_04580 [Candidatus Limnocylindrus sp.]
MTHHVDLHAFGVTAERGFLPIADPATEIPTANPEWHKTARDLPALLPSGKIRAIIEALPEFRSEALSSEEDLEAAMRTLSYLGMAYVWGEPESPSALPARLAVPWQEIAAVLGREPILSYASYALWNWRRLDQSGPIALGNIALLQHFLGGLDEAWFILIHVDIERRAGAALAAGARAQAAISDGNDAEATSALNDLGDALGAVADHHHRAGRVDRLKSVDDVQHHRASADHMQRLGPRRLHAGTVPRGKNDGGGVHWRCADSATRVVGKFLVDQTAGGPEMNRMVPGRGFEPL